MRAAVAALILSVGLLGFPAAGRAALAGTAIECVGYRDGGDRLGAAHLRVSNPGAASVEFEVRHLDLDRGVLYAERFDLAGGAERDLETALRNAGYAAQVLSPGDLTVTSYVLYDGEAERHEVACGPGSIA